MRLSVATFNIRLGWGRDGRHVWWLRRKHVVTVARDLDVDVLALQEAYRFQLRHLRRRLPGYAVVGVGRDDGRRRGEHCALLVRRDRLVVEQHETRWYSDTPDRPGEPWGSLPRVATLAVLASTVTGQRVGVCNTHWDHESGALRERGADALLGWLGERADVQWLILGDLNATPAAPEVRRLLDAGWTDALAALPADGPLAATNHDWTGRIDGTRIDHVLVPAGWDVESVEIVHDRPRGHLASDHWPVRATLTRG